MSEEENEAFTAFYTRRRGPARGLGRQASVHAGECARFRFAFDARSIRNGSDVPKEGVQKCPLNFAKCGPIVMKFCTMVEEALGIYN